MAVWREGGRKEMWEVGGIWGGEDRVEKGREVGKGREGKGREGR